MAGALVPCEEAEGGHCEGTEGECTMVGLVGISVYLRSTNVMDYFW